MPRLQARLERGRLFIGQLAGVTRQRFHAAGLNNRKGTQRTQNNFPPPKRRRRDIFVETKSKNV
jgi:hypothetical protein